MVDEFCDRKVRFITKEYNDDFKNRLKCILKIENSEVRNYKVINQTIYFYNILFYYAIVPGLQSFKVYETICKLDFKFENYFNKFFYNNSITCKELFIPFIFSNHNLLCILRNLTGQDKNRVIWGAFVSVLVENEMFMCPDRSLLDQTSINEKKDGVFYFNFFDYFKFLNYKVSAELNVSYFFNSYYFTLKNLNRSSHFLDYRAFYEHSEQTRNSIEAFKYNVSGDGNTGIDIIFKNKIGSIEAKGTLVLNDYLNCIVNQTTGRDRFMYPNFFTLRSRYLRKGIKFSNFFKNNKWYFYIYNSGYERVDFDSKNILQMFVPITEDFFDAKNNDFTFNDYKQFDQFKKDCFHYNRILRIIWKDVLFINFDSIKIKNKYTNMEMEFEKGKRFCDYDEKIQFLVEYTPKYVSPYKHYLSIRREKIKKTDYIFEKVYFNNIFHQIEDVSIVFQHHDKKNK